jgi:hypothetical protein
VGQCRVEPYARKQTFETEQLSLEKRTQPGRIPSFCFEKESKIDRLKLLDSRYKLNHRGVNEGLRVFYIVSVPQGERRGLSCRKLKG